MSNSATDSVTVFRYENSDSATATATATAPLAEVRKDKAGYHYMANVSAIAFNSNPGATWRADGARGANTFATCQDSVNTYPLAF